MDRRVLSVGVMIFLIGIFLIFAYWPLAAVGGDKLAEDRVNRDYESYKSGGQELIYGLITDVRVSDLPGWMDNLSVTDKVYIEIDGDIGIVITGRSDTELTVGEEVYGKCVLKETKIDLEGTSVSCEYWELKDELRSKQTLDYIFYGIAGTGIVIGIAGAAKV